MLQAQIYFDKDDRHQDEPLDQFIMRFLMQHEISGATCFKGLTGFGSNQYLKQPGLLFSFDEPPMMITFVDEDEKIKATVMALRKEFKGGMVLTMPVQKW